MVEPYRAKRGERLAKEAAVEVKPYRAKPHSFNNGRWIYYAEDVERERAELDKQIQKLADEWRSINKENVTKADGWKLRAEAAEGKVADLERWWNESVEACKKVDAQRQAAEEKLAEVSDQYDSLLDEGRLTKIEYWEKRAIKAEKKLAEAEKFKEKLLLTIGLTDTQAEKLLRRAEEAEARVAGLREKIKAWEKELMHIDVQAMWDATDKVRREMREAVKE